MRKGYLVLSIAYVIGAGIAAPFDMTGTWIFLGCAGAMALMGLSSAHSQDKTDEIRRRYNLPVKDRSGDFF